MSAGPDEQPIKKMQCDNKKTSISGDLNGDLE